MEARREEANRRKCCRMLHGVALMFGLCLFSGDSNTSTVLGAGMIEQAEESRIEDGGWKIAIGKEKCVWAGWRSFCVLFDGNGFGSGSSGGPFVEV